MVNRMAKKPIIFAMANPDPEITPEDVLAARDDAIIATGRSDYPNQINNVLGFPFMFRGALDVQASDDQRRHEDRRRPCAGGAGSRGGARSGRRRISRPAAGIRSRLHHPGAIRSAADDARAAGGGAGSHGQWRCAPADRQHGRLRRPAEGRLDPVAGWLHVTFDKVRAAPKRVIFAEGEEPAVIRAANAYFRPRLRRADAGRQRPTTVKAQLQGPRHQAQGRVRALLDTRTLALYGAIHGLLYKRLQRRG